MRNVSLLLSLAVLGSWTLTSSATEALAATGSGQKPLGTMVVVESKSAAADTMAVATRNESGSTVSGQERSLTVEPKQERTSNEKTSIESLSAEELEYWSTIDLIEK